MAQRSGWVDGEHKKSRVCSPTVCKHRNCCRSTYSLPWTPCLLCKSIISLVMVPYREKHPVLSNRSFQTHLESWWVEHFGDLGVARNRQISALCSDIRFLSFWTQLRVTKSGEERNWHFHSPIPHSAVSQTTNGQRFQGSPCYFCTEIAQTKFCCFPLNIACSQQKTSCLKNNGF